MEKKSLFTLRNVVRVLAILCIIFVFCPTFIVSCGDEKLELSAMDISTASITYLNEEVAGPQPIMLISLLLPIAILWLTIQKKIQPEKKVSLIIAACSGADIVVWLICKSVAASKVAEYYSQISTTPWYAFNLIVLFLLTGAALLAFFGIILPDEDLQTKSKQFQFGNGGGIPFVNQNGQSKNPGQNPAGEQHSGDNKDQ